MKTKKRDLFIAFAVGFILILAFISDSKPSRRSSSSGPVVAAGGAPAAINEKVYDRLSTLAAARDTGGISRLIDAGLAAQIESGTRVIVIDLGFLKTEIKVQEGPYSGRYFIVATEDIDR